MRRFLRFLGSLNHAGLAGALILLPINVVDPNSNLIGLALAGWLLGVGIVGIIRLFRVSPGVYPIVGLIAGPIPFTLVFSLTGEVSKEDWTGFWILSAILGAVIGTLEWARIRYLASVGERSGPPPE